MTTLRYHVDTQLARLLAENYRSSEAALKELVDNAWDADAEMVRISLPAPMTQEPIVIDDDGSGMTETELQQEYLLIASGRAQRRGELTAKKKRRAKGRKGIGKFAGLMAAQSMQLETWARGRRSGFSPSASDCRAAKLLRRSRRIVAPLSARSGPCPEITLCDWYSSLCCSSPSPARSRPSLRPSCLIVASRRPAPGVRMRRGLGKAAVAWQGRLGGAMCLALGTGRAVRGWARRGGRTPPALGRVTARRAGRGVRMRRGLGSADRRAA